MNLNLLLVVIFRYMESLQYTVEKAVHFYHKTLFTAKLAGPFTDPQLQSMFAEAHFIAELSSLPPGYDRVVAELQERYRSRQITWHNRTSTK